jgi:hypothetical protein
MPTNRQIMICFVRSDSAVLQESWLNTAASYFAPRAARTGAPYIHAELLFVPKNNALRNSAEVYGDACSIVYSGTVHMTKKRFSRKEWEFRSMECTEKQYKTMKNFCNEHVGESFNHVGYFMYWAGIFAPKPIFYTYFGMYPRWYCSEIVIGALKAGGILENTFPSAEHPDRLYHHIKSQSMMDCGRNMKEVQLQFV